MINKTKSLGQIYTPKRIVQDVLDLVGYNGRQILNKHIIDNSCGDGAFLKEIIGRYIETYERCNGTKTGIENELETYLHGIEIDPIEYDKCINNLDEVASIFGLRKVKWSVVCGDALTVDGFDSKMDYVVGNPPYVRIHNLQGNFFKIRNFSFCQSGMVDLFIVFYEIGFKMLNNNGKLCYITPNSFYSSVAGQELRRFIIENKFLFSIVDLGHYQPFNATTYTTICAFDKAKQFDHFEYNKYTNDGEIVFEELLDLKEAFNNGKMILAKKREQDLLKDIQNYIPQNNKLVIVKNGFATLCDSVFIKNEFDFDSNVIDVIKASTGEWKKCIFPYDEYSSIVSFEDLGESEQIYLLQHKCQLVSRSIDKHSPWYAFGRSQALFDVNKNKFAINNIIKDASSIKINYVANGKGVYSGLYVVTSLTKERLEKYIKSDEFIDYVKVLGKCKSGGYYTFSSLDLKQFLIYQMENDNEQ